VIVFPVFFCRQKQKSTIHWFDHQRPLAALVIVGGCHRDGVGLAFARGKRDVRHGGARARVGRHATQARPAAVGYVALPSQQLVSDVSKEKRATMRYRTEGKLAFPPCNEQSDAMYIFPFPINVDV
jgi:hypothetical protein